MAGGAHAFEECGQFQQVLDPERRTPGGDDNEGIRWVHVGPPRWDAGQGAVIDEYEHSVLRPVVLADHQVEHPTGGDGTGG